MKILILLLVVFLSFGCASNKAGGKVWYKNRTMEIEQAYSDGSLTKSEYIERKNEADLIYNQ